jgi:hypothetical protein
MYRTLYYRGVYTDAFITSNRGMWGGCAARCTIEVYRVTPTLSVSDAYVVDVLHAL